MGAVTRMGRSSRTTPCALVSGKQGQKGLMVGKKHQKPTNLMKAVFRPRGRGQKGTRKEKADSIMHV